MVNMNNDKPFLIPEKKGGFSDFSNVVSPPSDKSVVLWRYLDLAKLVVLLNDKKLHFTRADVFQDQHEGSITKSMMETVKQQLADRAQLAVTLSRFRRLVKESTFISCWCMDPESEAMWKLYCGDKYGIAITTIYRDIETYFTDRGLLVAPVKYLDYKVQGFPQDNLLYPFFHKRLEFAHEREVRIVEWCSDQMPVGIRVKGPDPPTEEEIKEHQDEIRRGEMLKAERGMGILLDFDAETMVKTIVVHPNAPEWYFRVIQLVVEKFTPILVEKVKWSSMRTEPLY